jgi:hypothetical protein
MQVYSSRTMEGLFVKTVDWNGNRQIFLLNFERALQRANFNRNFFDEHFILAIANILLPVSFNIYAYTKALEGKKKS